MSQSVKKAFSIIRFLAGNQGDMNLSALSKAINMNKATTYRYLDTLESLHVLARRGDHYYLGLELFELGNKVYTKELIVNRIRPILKNLCHQVNETVSLAQIYDHEALYLDKIESNRSLQFQATVGNRLPLHCTALGKTILAILPPHQAELAVNEIVLDPLTSYTITSRDLLQQEIQKVRKEGFALDSEEFEEGLTCVAVPLLIETLDFYGGISISGPSFRITGEVIADLAVRLKATVRTIGQELSNNSTPYRGDGHGPGLR